MSCAHSMIHVIAIITTQKVAALPQVKTVAESGIPDFEYPSWLGLLGPAKTPPAILAAMSAEARKAVMAPELAESMQAEAIIPVGSTPEQFARMLATEIARMRKVIAEAGIRAE